MATIGEFIAKLGFKIDKKSSSEFEKSFKEKEKGIKKFGEEFKKNATVVTKKAIEMGNKISENAKKLNEFTNKVILKTKELAQKATVMATGFYGVLSGITFGVGKLIKNYLSMDRAIEDSNAPPKLEKQAIFVKEISDKVQVLKKTFTNFLNWVGYFLLKNLEQPLGKIKNVLISVDKTLKNDIKKTAENVAKVLGYFVRLLTNNLQFVIMVVKKLGTFFLEVSEKIDKVKFAWVAFTALLLINPIFALFTGLMLLVDDFIVHINGGESALGDLWDKLIGWYKEIENSGAIENFKSNFINAFEKLGQTIENIAKTTGNFFLAIAKNKTAVKVISELAKFFVKLMIIAKIIGWIQKIVTVLIPIIKIIMAIFSALTPIQWAILAIIAIVTLLVKHWEGFKEVFINICIAIKDFFVNIFTSIKDFFVNIWEGIKSIFTNIVNGIVNFFKSSWDGLKNVVTAFKDFYFGIWTGIWNKSKEIITKIKDFFKNGFASMKENANDLLNKFSFGLLGKKKDNTTQGKASGGVVSSEGTYRIAENNQPEAIIPLSPTKRGRAIGLLNRVNEFMNIPKIVSSTNGINRQTRGSNNFNNVSNNSYSININVTGNQNPTDIAREVEKVIKRVQNNSLMDRYKNGIQMSNVGGNVI